jgi:ABC-2 type transport system ATP-binding protein
MSKSLSDLARGEGPIISASGIVKRFGSTTALDGLDLSVREHEVHGFLGPNGAGKSTTIRAILGQLRLNAGALSVFGLDPWRQAVAVHSRLAYVPGDVVLWPGLTGGECIDLLGSLQGQQNRERRNELIARFDLDPTKKTRTYSKGNRQKVALIAALSTEADLLLLDEPTSGLDPLMESQFQTCIREATLQGRTVLLSSHILAEVEALCERVSIVRRGRIVRTGTLGELREDTLTSITVSTPLRLDPLSALGGVTIVSERTLPEGVHTVARVTSDSLAEAVQIVSRAHPTILTVQPPSLDELFLDLYRDVPVQQELAPA